MNAFSVKGRGWYLCTDGDHPLACAKFLPLPCYKSSFMAPVKPFSSLKPLGYESTSFAPPRFIGRPSNLLCQPKKIQGRTGQVCTVKHVLHPGTDRPGQVPRRCR